MVIINIVFVLNAAYTYKDQSWLIHSGNKGAWNIKLNKAFTMQAIKKQYFAILDE